MAIQHNCGIGQMPVKDELQQTAHVVHLVSRQRGFAKYMGKAGAFQQPISLAKRQVEDLG